MPLTTAELGFDRDAVREKYREERDKRLRADGNQQYIDVKGDFARYIEDPWLERQEREPLFDSADVIIIGGGFGGLLAGARLRQAGVEDIRIIDNGGGFGGTWYWNRYPGAQCDVESYIYLPLLEELGYMPKEKYSFAPEILAHSQAMGRKFDLYRNVCFQTEVKELRWDGDEARWIVSTDRGDRMKARFVCMSTGFFNRPKLPGIPGIDTFKGHTFHPSRWDYAYTGGDCEGNLDRLADKRVAVIGTGATAVQCVPHLGAAAQQLYNFQRTPSVIDVNHNHPTDPEWVKTLEPGWQKRRMDNFNIVLTGGSEEVDLVMDGWTELVHLSKQVEDDAAAGASGDAAARMAETVEIADFLKMEQIRSRVESIVDDPATAETLKPYYRLFCKRPCFHNEYLATFNRPNVQLVDTQGKGVERITEKAVVANGVEYEVDCIIYATGFEVGTSYTRRAGHEVIGRDGVTLTDRWADGMKTFHGVQTRGFPNCCFMGVTQSGFTTNYPHMLDEQAQHVAYLIEHGLRNDTRTIETSQEAEDEWVATINRLRNDGDVFINQTFLEACTPSYFNNEGVARVGEGLADGFYGGGPEEFFAIIRAWRAQGDLKGLEIS